MLWRISNLPTHSERKLEPPVANAQSVSGDDHAASGYLAADVAAEIVLRSLDDDKAEDVVSIDVRGRSSLADRLIVASGRSQRHVGALAEHLVKKLREAGGAELQVEGLPQCDWVLVDAGDLIVHLFRPEVRSFYDIEKIWAAPGKPAA